MTENLRDTLDGSGPRDLRQRIAHHFANDELAQILALLGEVENLIFVNRADGKIFLEDRNL